jgi:hypothetical protein
MAYKVFISYSTNDIPNVDALRKLLQFPDVECFVSEYAVTPGAPLAPTIKNAIQTCDLFVVLWSKNALASEWVSQEIGIAHGGQKPILPFVLEKNLQLPGFIKELRYVAAFQDQFSSAGGHVEIEIGDCFGNLVKPREWFLVPLFVVNELVERIRDGSITGYVYDPKAARLVKAAS